MRVIAVDPFYGDYDSGDSMSLYFRGLRQEFGHDKFSALWAQAIAYEGGRNFGCRYSLYNTYSEKAAVRFPKRSIDMMCVVRAERGPTRRHYAPLSTFCPLLFPPPSTFTSFIDGDHTLQGVESDIRAWAPILKVGRMMLFNDYQPATWPGVVKAVDALAERTAQAVYFLPQVVYGNVGLFNVPELFTTPTD